MPQALVVDENKLYLALDVGLKRTGVASGQTLTKSAQPAGQIVNNNRQDFFIQLDTLINKWQPEAVIIGQPHSNDSQLNKMIRRIRHHLQAQHKLEVHLFNETLSTEAANTSLDNSNIRRSQKTVQRDQIAACLILQSYFNSH